jgi:hypothetical protein
VKYNSCVSESRNRPCDGEEYKAKRGGAEYYWIHRSVARVKRIVRRAGLAIELTRNLFGGAGLVKKICQCGWCRLSAGCVMQSNRAWPGRMSVRRSRVRQCVLSSGASAPKIGLWERSGVAVLDRYFMSPLRGFDDITQLFRGLTPTAKIFRRCAAGWPSHPTCVRPIVGATRCGSGIQLLVS